MPIEIRELVITTKVEDMSQQGGSGNGEGGRNTSSTASALSDDELQSIIEMCTEAVLKIMERQKNR